MKKELDQYTIVNLRNVLLEILDEFVRICGENKLIYFLHAGTLLGAVRHNGFIPWDDDIDVAMPRKDYEKFLDVYNKLGKTDYYVLSDRNTNNNHHEPFAKLCKKGTVFAESAKDEYTGIYIDIFPFDNCVLSFTFIQTILIKFVLLLCKYKFHKYIPKKKNKKLFFILFIKPLCFFLSQRFLYTLHKKLYLMFNTFNTKYISSFTGFYGYKRETHKYNTIFPLSSICFEGKKYCAPCNYDLFLKNMYGNYMELPPVEKQINHNPKYIIFNDVS